jgi:hypothetical protein
MTLKFVELELIISRKQTTSLWVLPQNFFAGMGDVFSISLMEDRFIINFIITFKVN